jgi:hypothetical protein
MVCIAQALDVELELTMCSGGTELCGYPDAARCMYCFKGLQ